jgi:hypothetical protein
VYKKDPKIRKEILYSIFNRSQFEKFPTILETDLGPDSQYTRTPSWIAEEVIETSLFTEDFMKSSGSDILKTSMKFQIWFNLEFLEILRYKHDILGRKILFITDSLIKAKWAKTLYDVDVRIVPSRSSIIETEGRVMPKSSNLIVIGNPPYHTQSDKQKLRDVDGADQTKPIYDKFITTIIDNIKPRKLSFIIPSKWMSGGMGLESFRTRFMTDKRIKSIKHFPGAKSVFKTAEIGGGVNYFLWDSEYSGPCNFNGQDRHLDEFDIIIQDNMACSLIRTIRQVSSKYVSDTVCSRKPFGIASNFSDFAKDGIRCHVVDKTEKFVELSKFTDKNNILHKYKVCMAGASGFFREGKYTIGNPFIIPPNEICTETYIVINSFETKHEAENFIEYAHTKFFKFLLWQMLTTQNNSRKCFMFVPDQVDYTQTYTSEYLYKKYNLSEQQISYIEQKIKQT